MSTSRQPLLPNGDSQARGQMQGRFANGEVFNLRIPAPDYDLGFTDMSLKRGVAGQNNIVRVEGTGLRYTLRATDTELKQPVTTGTFQVVQMDTLAVTSPPMDGWVAVSNALRQVTGSIGAAAERGDRKWLQANDATKNSMSTLPSWLRKRCGS
jgi:hypothetical protein